MKGGLYGWCIYFFRDYGGFVSAFWGENCEGSCEGLDESVDVFVGGF